MFLSSVVLSILVFISFTCNKIRSRETTFPDGFHFHILECYCIEHKPTTDVPFTVFDSAMCSHCALNFVIIWLYIHALNLQDIKTPACGAMPRLCFSFLLLQWLSKLLSCPPLSLGNTPCWFSLGSEAWTTKMAPQGRKEMLASRQEGVKSKPKLVKT